MMRNLANTFTRQRDLTSGSIGKAVWILSIPMILGNLLQGLYNLINMFWVGRLGPNAVAAVSLSGAIIMLVLIIIMGISIGTVALISRFAGQKNMAEANIVAAQSINFALVCSIALSFLGILYAPQMLGAMGGTPEIVAMGKAYTQVLFGGMLAFFFYATFMSILQGVGDTLTPNIVLVITVVLNTILDPILIFGIGVPAMGIVGAAWATVISQVIGDLIALEILLRGRSRIHIKFRHFLSRFDYIWKIFVIGVPASAQMSMRSIMMVVLMAIVAGYGTFAVAAYGIGMRIYMLIQIPGFVMGNAVATLVGQNLGANKPERAQESAWTAVNYYLYMMIAFAAISFIFAPGLIKIFSDDPQVVAIGAGFLRFSSISLFAFPVGLILSRGMGGAGETIIPMVITFVSLWLFLIPLAIILPHFFNLGIEGIWVATVLGSILQAIITAVVFQQGKWKLKKV